MATSPLISLLLEIENTLKVFPQPDYEDIPIELLVALDELTKATRGALNLLDGNIDAKDADAQVHELDIKALISGDVIAFIIGDINGKHHVVTEEEALLYIILVTAPLSITRITLTRMQMKMPMKTLTTMPMVMQMTMNIRMMLIAST